MTTLELAVPAGLEQYRGSVRAAIVLGSGFGGVIEAVDAHTTIDYADIDGFPAPGSHVAGHAGRLVLGTLGAVPVAVFQGRVHMYQGVSALDAAWTARLAHALGAEVLVLTNAAGGVSLDRAVGDVVLIEDHMNLTGASPLTGWPGPEGGVPFVPMTEAYDPELRRIARIVAADVGLTLSGGVYAWLPGPAYETPAEVEALRVLGADVVGMSTVPETIVARALGLRVLGLSLVTNAAAGADLGHDEVLAVGRRAEEGLAALVTAIVERL